MKKLKQLKEQPKNMASLYALLEAVRVLSMSLPINIGMECGPSAQTALIAVRAKLKEVV